MTFELGQLLMTFLKWEHIITVVDVYRRSSA